MTQNKTLDYFLKTAWQSVVNKYNLIASQFGFTQAAGYILINIHKEGTTVSQIAMSTGVKATSLSRVLNNLENLGFIYREASSTDKRSVKVFLTPLGIEKRKIAKNVVLHFNEYLESNITSEEKQVLIDTLIKINDLTAKYTAQVEIEDPLIQMD